MAREYPSHPQSYQEQHAYGVLRVGSQTARVGRLGERKGRATRGLAQWELSTDREVDQPSAGGCAG
eukprot:5578949-Prymnesium_polylepis.1